MNQMTRCEPSGGILSSGAGVLVSNQRAAAARYVVAFMQNFNWDEVNRRVVAFAKI